METLVWSIGVVHCRESEMCFAGGMHIQMTREAACSNNCQGHRLSVRYNFIDVHKADYMLYYKRTQQGIT